MKEFPIETEDGVVIQNLENIYFVQLESNDTWARDHGGITVIEEKKAVIHDYIFNGWGKKFEAGLDNQITKKCFEKGVFQDAFDRSQDLAEYQAQYKAWRAGKREEMPERAQVGEIMNRSFAYTYKF